MPIELKLDSDPVPTPTIDDDDNEEIEELQCEDMPDNPDMDPLEYTVRRILPIPKKYFWERKDPTDPNEADHTETLSFRTKLWHRSVAILGKALYVAEYAGEVIAHVFGLNESRYQYVIDNMSEDDWERARKVNEEREKEWAEHLAAKEVEEETGVKANAL